MEPGRSYVAAVPVAPRRRRRALLTGACLQTVGLAAERRRQRRLRDLRLRPQRRDAQPRADRAGAAGAAEDAPPGRQRRRGGRRLRPDARHPAEDLGRGGPQRRSRPLADPRRRTSPSPTSSSSARRTARRSSTTPASCSPRAASASSPSARAMVELDRRWARPRARRSRSSGSSPASSPTPSAATRSSSSCCIGLEQPLDVHVPSFSATTCVYKVMGAPNVLGDYYPDLTDPRFETVGCFGHNRYSTNTWPSFKRVQPFSAIGHNGEINTIEQLRQEAKMLAVPIRPGASDSQDLNRTIDTMVSREGLSLAEAMEMLLPPIVEEIQRPAGGPAQLLHVPAPGDGAVRPGPGRADRPPRRRVRLLRRRDGPAPALAGRDRGPTSSSAPSPASSRSTRWSPSRSRSLPARRRWS